MTALHSNPYRDRGHDCIYSPCRQCGGMTVHTTLFVPEVQAERAYSIGCGDCGCHQFITRELYRQFDSMRDFFIALESDEISIEEFESAMPAEARQFLADAGAPLSEQPRPRTPSLLRDDAASAPIIRLSNSLGSGLVVAVPIGLSLNSAIPFVLDAKDLPDFIRRPIESVFGANYVILVLTGVAACVTFLYVLLRYIVSQPRSMIITPKGIELRYPARRQFYTLEDVRKIESREDSLVEIRFADGKRAKFDSDFSINVKLSRYFRGL